MKERIIRNEIQKRPKKEINILVHGTIPKAGSFCFQLPQPNKDFWWSYSVELAGHTLLIDKMGRKASYSQKDFGKDADVLININHNKVPISVSPDCLIVDYNSEKATRDECLIQIVKNYNEIEEAVQKSILFLLCLTETDPVSVNLLPEIKSLIACTFFSNVVENHKKHIFIPELSSTENCSK
ncbi:MAG: hypothetical protein H0U73_06035 [Tatlockia sp.]|nr:hypothetical protein [Tatlockia sp.]